MSEAYGKQEGVEYNGHFKTTCYHPPIDKDKAFTSLRELIAVSKTGDFSALFLRKVSSQLKMINPQLHNQAETEGLFIEEEAKDDLDTDLCLLQKILAHEWLTHDERRSEMRKLNNLHTALQDKETDTCPVIMKMFNSIPQKYWPDLFVYFNAEIIYVFFSRWRL